MQLPAHGSEANNACSLCQKGRLGSVGEGVKGLLALN